MNSDGSCNTSIVGKSLEKINKSKIKLIIILKSNLQSPGTTEKYNDLYENISIVFNPEFLTERNAVMIIKIKIRIIIGGQDHQPQN